jgi:hypothetical protein
MYGNMELRFVSQLPPSVQYFPGYELNGQDWSYFSLLLCQELPQSRPILLHKHLELRGGLPPTLI